MGKLGKSSPARNKSQVTRGKREALLSIRSPLSPIVILLGVADRLSTSGDRSRKFWSFRRRDATDIPRRRNILKRDLSMYCLEKRRGISTCVLYTVSFYITTRDGKQNGSARFPSRDIHSRHSRLILLSAGAETEMPRRDSFSRTKKWEVRSKESHVTTRVVSVTVYCLPLKHYEKGIPSNRIKNNYGAIMDISMISISISKAWTNKFHEFCGEFCARGTPIAERFPFSDAALDWLTSND